MKKRPRNGAVFILQRSAPDDQRQTISGRCDAGRAGCAAPRNGAPGAAHDSGAAEAAADGGRADQQHDSSGRLAPGTCRGHIRRQRSTPLARPRLQGRRRRRLPEPPSRPTPPSSRRRLRRNRRCVRQTTLQMQSSYVSLLYTGSRALLPVGLAGQRSGPETIGVLLQNTRQSVAWRRAAAIPEIP